MNDFDELGAFDLNLKALFGSQSSVTDYSGKPVLKQGDRGEAVVELQSLLNIQADGVFGAGTKGAVKSFQSQKGLPGTGIVNGETWAALYGEPTKGSKEYKKGRRKETAGRALDWLSSLLPSAPSTSEELVAFEPSSPEDTNPEPEGSSWGVVPWVVGGVVVIGGAVVGIAILSRSRQE